MLPISDILIRSISGYVFIIPVLILYFFVLKKSGRKQSVFHIIAVFVFCYYLFGNQIQHLFSYRLYASFRKSVGSHRSASDRRLAVSSRMPEVER